MANIQERRDKAGKLISYSVRVHRGRGADGKQLKPWTATFEVSPTWTEKSARKKAEAFAATFEKECREGLTSDSRQKFAAYCDYVIELKEQRGMKHSTIVRYKELTTRIYPAIGHIKLRELRADHLNSLYTQLAQPGAGKGSGRAIAKVDLAALLKEKGLTRSKLAEDTGVPLRTVYAAVKGERVSQEAAEAISAALSVNAFRQEDNARTLSAKTILEHHRLISTVLQGRICCIKVLGSGCCHALYENTQSAVKAMGISVEVEYITDLKKVMEYGVMSVPALVVNNKVVSTGKVLKTENVQKLLQKIVSEK